uniref:Secreted protein n=1 Tax=Parascaris univalens TaxID=6257 RepID=A0A915AR93_PARUN
MDTTHFLIAVVFIRLFVQISSMFVKSRSMRSFLIVLIVDEFEMNDFPIRVIVDRCLIVVPGDVNPAISPICIMPLLTSYSLTISAYEIHTSYCLEHFSNTFSTE